MIERKFILVAACALAGAAAPPAEADEVPFTASANVVSPAGSQPRAVAQGDFDSDGKQDLVVAERSSNAVRIQMGTGDGTFRPADDTVSIERPQSLVVGDFDADGTQDLAVGGKTPGGHELMVLRGVGDGGFSVMATFDIPGGEAAIHLARGDLNGDGRDDLVAVGLEWIAVLRAQSSGTFAQNNSRFTPSRPGDVEIADFDGDGVVDIALLLEFDANRLGIMRGKGDGTFHAVETSSLANTGETLAVGDFNADGLKDLAISLYTERKIDVRLGRGDGTFSDDVDDLIVGDQPYEVVVADFDADGREDLAVPNAGDGTVEVRRGNGDATFAPGSTVEVGDFPIVMAAGDFDANGKADFVAMNYDDGYGSVRLGTGRAALQGNLLENGGFEDGIGARLPNQAPAANGWSRTGLMTYVRYGTVPHGGFPSLTDAPRFSVGGRNFLWGGDSSATGGITTASQQVDVNRSAREIDNGRATAHLSAFLGGAQIYEDRMQVTAEFLDPNGAVLGVLQVGPVTRSHRHNVTTLLYRAGSSPVPQGTRAIRLTAMSIDTDAISSAMADNVKLTLSVEPEPVPVPPAGGGGGPTPGGGGAPSPGSPQNPASPSAFGAATRVSVKLSASRIRRTDPIGLVVANSNPFAVRGSVSGVATGGSRKRSRIGARKLTVPASGRARVKLPLSSALRRRLASGRKLTVRLSLVVADPAGNKRTIKRSVTVRLRR